MEATALVVSAGQQLRKWLVEEAKYLYAVNDKVEELQKELEWIQCFLRSADEKKRDDELVRKWIAEINDFSYEAEDILEKYLLKVSHLRNDGSWNLLKWVTCAVGDARSCHEVGSEIDLLTSKISKLSSRMITYGVTPTSLSISVSQIKEPELRRAHSHLPVDDVVGLEEDKTILVDQLMNKGTKVIGICGMAGSGKTTLARKVYQEVKGRQFEKCAWVYVSQKFKARDVIQVILLKLNADDGKQRKIIIQNAAEGPLEGQLYSLLQQKKCLVVLDDIWTFKDWDCLKNAFPISSTDSRSKLLITTRYKDLLSRVDPQGFSHQLRLLTTHESLKLFYRKAFLGNNTICTDPEMKKLGRKMVAQCDGLPLEIVALGGLLAPKKTLEEWKSVHKTFIQRKNDEGMGVTDVLKLSYTNLPYNLRPCFLHLGNFPQGFEIPTKKLYRMWIAEGIVAPRDDHEDMLAMNLEDTANSYLHELVQRCIVQVSKIGPARKIRSCRLHDLMWEMCTSKAKEENFLHIVRTESMNVGYGTYLAKRTGNLHRLAIHFGQGIQSTNPSQFNKASHLRSLMFFSSDPVDQSWLKTMIKEFKLLRVLDLENTGIKEDFSEIGNFIHLRYLSIKGTQVRRVPSSIGNLRCLQTLDLRVYYPDECIMEIPNVLWKMKRLKHLYLPSHAYKVKWFQNLRITGLSNLEILKNLDTRISPVTNLHKLESLKKLSIKNNVSKVETLKIIMECQSIKYNSLVHLYLKIHAAILDEESTILSSCSYLHTLEIEGTNSVMTDLRLESVKFPENLKNLAIKNCKLMCTDPMQNVKHLPDLSSLSLDTVSFSGNCMDCSDRGFLQLIDLKLSNMETLMEWKVGEEAMPKIHRLQIYNCKKLLIPDGLPTSVHIVCNPCVNGINKYFTCPFQKVELVDDVDDDLATRYCNKKRS